MRLFIPSLVLLFQFFAVPSFAEDAKDSAGMKNMAFIEGGMYEMGSRRSLQELNPGELMHHDRHSLGPENPAHHVHVDAFYMDIYEVTNADYQEYVKATGAKQPALAKNPDFNEPKQPVVGVSWKEAVKFCKWKGKRLPTEAEWEKASRGKRRVIYPWGNELPDKTKVNFKEQVNKTTPVGSYEAGKSDYGVYDLSGNVAEWTHDWHLAEYYLFSPKANPKGHEKGQYKVIRGGNWRNTPHDVNMVYRNATLPTVRNKTVGFRCVKSEGGE
jgi:formylglycine-generating enzyme required for sulfatase activity